MKATDAAAVTHAPVRPNCRPSQSAGNTTSSPLPPSGVSRETPTIAMSSTGSSIVSRGSKRCHGTSRATRTTTTVAIAPATGPAWESAVEPNVHRSSRSRKKTPPNSSWKRPGSAIQANRRSSRGIRERPAVAPVSSGVGVDRLPEVPPVDVGPQHVGEDELGVRGLPEHEVREPLLPRRPPDEVGVGDLGDVEVPGERLLVDFLGVEPAGGDLAADGTGCVGELRAAAVVDAHRQRQDVVLAGEVLGDAKLLDHRLPQPWRPAGPTDPDAELVHLVTAATDHVAVEAHQELHLVGRPAPVLGREGVGGDRLHPDLDRALDDVEERVLPLLVALGAGQPA